MRRVGSLIAAPIASWALRRGVARQIPSHRVGFVFASTTLRGRGSLARSGRKLLDRAVVEYGRSLRADTCVFRRPLPAPDAWTTPTPIGVVLGVVSSS